jgi:RNA polymerase sigma-70 factor, ECF subfamily
MEGRKAACSAAPGAKAHLAQAIATCYGEGIMSTSRFVGVTLDRELAGVGSDESALVAELKAGSEQAFAYLLGIYQNPVYNLALHMVQSESDAADVLQETFVKIFRGIRQFHEASSLKTWIYRIAIREALNFRRSRGRRLSHEPFSVDEDREGASSWENGPAAVSESPWPDRIFEQGERQEAVRRALASLAQPYRAVLVLREIESCSYDEISHILSMAPGTVKSRLKRGRELLRRKLQPRWGH